MAKPGDVLENPATGQTLTFRRTGADTGGELLEIESCWESAGPEPPEHYHPHQVERFEILEGELCARIGGTEHTFKAGGEIDVPAGTPHTMWNPGPGRTRALWQTRPAMRTEGLFELMWGIAQAAARGEEPPSPEQAAAMLAEYSEEFRLGRPEAG